MRINRVDQRGIKWIRCLNPNQRRIISSVTIVLFSWLTISCTYTKLVKVEPGKDYKTKKIIGFIKKTGEEVELPRGKPVVVHQSVIETREKIQRQYEIKTTDVKSIENQPDIDGGIRYKITTSDGKTYFPKSIVNKDDKLVFSAFEPLSIPLSDILMFKIEKITPGTKLFFAALAISIVAYLVMSFTLKSPHYKQ